MEEIKYKGFVIIISVLVDIESTTIHAWIDDESGNNIDYDTFDAKYFDTDEVIALLKKNIDEM